MINNNYILVNKEVKNILDLDKDLSNVDKINLLDIYHRVEYYGLMKIKKKEDSFLKKGIKSWSKDLGVKDGVTSKYIEYLVSKDLLMKDESYKVGKYAKGLSITGMIDLNTKSLNLEEYLSKTQLSNRNKRKGKKMIDEKIEWHKEYLMKMLKLDVNKVLLLAYTDYGLVSTKENIYKDLVELELPPLRMYELTKEDLVELEKKSKLNVEDNKHKATNYKAELMRLKLKSVWHKLSKEDKLYNKDIASKHFNRIKLLELFRMEDSVVKLGGKSGRHYHVLSNASKEVRGCMIPKSTKKNYVISLDVKNSQPFLLLCKILNEDLEIEDIVKSHIIMGNFYELVADLLQKVDVLNAKYKTYKNEDKKYQPKYVGLDRKNVNNNGLERKEVKRIVYKDLFFCKTHSDRLNSDLYKIIELEYPLFANAINTLSNGNYSLASILQQLESSIIIPLTKKMKSVSIHDSLMLVAVAKDSNEIEKYKMEIEKAFLKATGLNPMVSSEIISYRN